MSTTLHLIPVSLGDSPVERWLPSEAQAMAGKITVYIAENAKTARAFLKQIGTLTAIQEITIYTLSPKSTDSEIIQWLRDPKANGHIGLVSEAGCPAVADPGAKVVMQSHKLGFTVIPWVGPSSILLGLMASGLDGQRFTFHGYAPAAPAERAKTLKQWEIDSLNLHQTQLFIETPYRNMAMFETLLNTLKPDTRLCVARALTTEQEWIKTMSVQQWHKQSKPELDKMPTLFLFLG